MAGILGGDPRHLEPYIRETAKKYGVDPDIAMRVARSEGLSNPIGDQGRSHGAFQLYTGGGEGNNFQKQTGLDPSNPANEQATIDYALKTAAQKGWGPWNGAKAQGITGMMGINQPGNPQMAAQASANTTGDAPAPPRPAAPTPNAGVLNTLSANSPLAGSSAPNATGASPLHSNEAVNTALSNAFRPIIPDQINSLLGPAIGAIQGHTNPIAFYQPRQAAPVPITRGSS